MNITCPNCGQTGWLLDHVDAFQGYTCDPDYQQRLAAETGFQPTPEQRKYLDEWGDYLRRTGTYESVLRRFAKGGGPNDYWLD